MGSISYRRARNAEGFSFNFKDSGSRETMLYRNTAFWRKGVMDMCYHYRIPGKEEMDVPAATKAMYNDFKEKIGFSGRNIFLFTPLSLYGGKRVYQLEITFKTDLPSQETILEWYEYLASFDFSDFMYI